MKALSDDEIKSLLNESFKNITTGTDYDSKKLNDMNNTLSWILTLTTFFFVIYNQLKVNLPHSGIFLYSIVFKIVFIISIANLIFHKYLLIQYEDYKGSYIHSLSSQYIDLIFNIDKLRPYIENLQPLNTYTFVNEFRDGKFAYNSAREITIAELLKTDNTINRYGGFIKISYFLGMVMFMMEFLFIAVCIFH